MNSLREINYKQWYTKAKDNVALDFYIPSLSRSSQYDRLSGYFGSTIFILAWSALKEFVKNNGKMRIICSPCLSEKDADAIIKGQNEKTNSIIVESLHKEISQLLEKDELADSFRILSTLIALGNIEIKIAYGEPSPEILRLFHEKAGIFSQNSDKVLFRGSFNETYKGLDNDDGNIESIDVFTNWLEENDRNRVESTSLYFEELWNSQIPQVKVIPLPEELRDKLGSLIPKGFSWEELVDEVEVKIHKPKSWFADSDNKRKPRKHQLQALDNWVNNGHRGIFEHATGSGKTFTALCAIRKSLAEKKVVLILVPSTKLLTQWDEEITSAFADIKITKLLCGAGYTRWKKNHILQFMSTYTKGMNKITIATMDTATSPDFLSLLNGNHDLFVVADEVHRMGSEKRRSFFNVNADYRLGVSATPKRYEDPLGSQSLIEYFGNILEPKFSLQDAIVSKVLTPYFYCPHIVELNDEEQQSWSALTKRINERFARNSTILNWNSKDDTYLQKLLLQRARIIKKASGKVNLALEILKKNFDKNQRWIIYCEDKSQLNSVSEAIQKTLPLVDVFEYYADMKGDREETLKMFELDGGVVVSIKCLDEGVDIPAVTHAIILASSKNPREFIQRRGRILRRSVGKNYSWLYDSIVLPSSISEESVICDSITLGELSRAIQFAEWADSSYGISKLRIVAASQKLNPNVILNIGSEDE